MAARLRQLGFQDMVESLGDSYEGEFASELRAGLSGSGKRQKKLSYYFLIHPENNQFLTFFDFYLANVNLLACVSVIYFYVFGRPNSPWHTLAESIITLSFIAELLTKCCR